MADEDVSRCAGRRQLQGPRALPVTWPPALTATQQSLPLLAHMRKQATCVYSRTAAHHLLCVLPRTRKHSPPCRSSAQLPTQHLQLLCRVKGVQVQRPRCPRPARRAGLAAVLPPLHAPRLPRRAKVLLQLRQRQGFRQLKVGMTKCELLGTGAEAWPHGSCPKAHITSPGRPQRAHLGVLLVQLRQRLGALVERLQVVHQPLPQQGASSSETALKTLLSVAAGPPRTPPHNTASPLPQPQPQLHTTQHRTAGAPAGSRGTAC